MRPICPLLFASRCNVQDYIWNKGTRCEWAVTEFQVLCVVVGVACIVFLMLFMIIVFFAKRLYQLKNENRRLCKRRWVRESEISALLCQENILMITAI